jgi:hypothetical protein
LHYCAAQNVGRPFETTVNAAKRVNFQALEPIFAEIAGPDGLDPPAKPAISTLAEVAGQITHKAAGRSNIF